QLLSCIALSLALVTNSQLEESGGGLVQTEGSLTLTCTASGFSFSNNDYICWVRQAPGKGLEWIGCIYSDYGFSFFATWAKDRFSGSKTSSTTVTLQGTGLTAADTATYFCVKTYVSRFGYYIRWDYFDLWGPGTLVIVSSGQ
uniref:LAVA01 mAb - Heavy Chain n=1 Tax=Oryctolagus cuniculus TaxID=9986 RepID=UPI0021D69F3E|nr:Chain H, LAVA01 mAb - Heavy Chain [Oryctolagus cuniculus]7SGF_J Chain J, LAVA01 mAb - Heavy Chain [Oryctolagus cuniculus]7SGF_M Chain M, LAVA01 mAb - Heavy Chain [Oryctolagus cuniculus]